jgi:ABC-type nitrate/sulfonate/bicarbonate transport system permease component
MRGSIAGTILPLALLGTWQLLASAGALPAYLVSPARIGSAFAREAIEGDLLKHTVATLLRVGVALGVAIAAGTVLGLACGSYRRLAEFFEPLVAMSYPVPKVIFLPLFVVWFGLGDVTIVVTATFAVFFPVFISAFEAARSVPRSLLWAGRAMGASGPRAFIRVIFPAALPALFSGLRVANATAFIVVFVAEIVSPRSGVGYLIQFASDFNRYDQVFVGVLTFGLLGFATDRGWLWLRRVMVPQPSHRA